MSRNFDVMQEMERDQAFHSDGTVEPAFPTLGEDRNRDTHRRLASDLTLTLVQRLFQQQTQEPPRMVVFAGIDHGNGCSQIAASVAESLAGNASARVCLVEANFRSPALPAILGTTNYHGLSDALLEEGSIRSFITPVRNEGLWLLSSGPLAADSPNLLISERMKARSAELRKEFDFVIVDAPPMARYADAIGLGQLSDGIVLVLEAESTRRETARMVVENLRSSGIQVLGAVLNKRTFPIPEKIYNKL
jgi:capsular exopolysaccharide synthesis family protein